MVVKEQRVIPEITWVLKVSRKSYSLFTRQNKKRNKQYRLAYKIAKEKNQNRRMSTPNVKSPCPEGALRVKPGKKSISKALKKAKKKKKKFIYLENGVHNENGKVLLIDFAVTIIGASQYGCILKTGFEIGGLVTSVVVFINLTLRETKGHGVYGYQGMSFILENVLIDKCREHGIGVGGTKKNQLINCEIRNCGKCGLIVMDGLIKIEGSNTKIHHNTGYGLYTNTKSSFIQVVRPLLYQTLSIDNIADRNWGGIGTITNDILTVGETKKIEQIKVLDTHTDGTRLHNNKASSSSKTSSTSTPNVSICNVTFATADSVAADAKSTAQLAEAIAETKKETTLSSTNEMVSKNLKKNQEKSWHELHEPTTTLRVKPGLNSLRKALEKVQENGILTLFLENGVHTTDVYYDSEGKLRNDVDIDFPIKIIGQSRAQCIFMGGMYLRDEKVAKIKYRDSEGNLVTENDKVIVKNLSITRSKNAGIFSNGLSFIIDNVCIDQNDGDGAVAMITEQNKIINCEISRNGGNGVACYEGLISIEGLGTTIHGNGTKGELRHHGLKTCTDTSTIQIIPPLTTEFVSKNNEAGRNWGGEGQIINEHLINLDEKGETKEDVHHIFKKLLHKEWYKIYIFGSWLKDSTGNKKYKSNFLTRANY